MLSESFCGISNLTYTMRHLSESFNEQIIALTQEGHSQKDIGSILKIAQTII